MQFVLTKEKQEADRKRIEAQVFQISKISLRAVSANNCCAGKGLKQQRNLPIPRTQSFVIGAGKDGLPLILDTK